MNTLIFIYISGSSSVIKRKLEIESKSNQQQGKKMKSPKVSNRELLNVKDNDTPGNQESLVSEVKQNEKLTNIWIETSKEDVLNDRKFDDLMLRLANVEEKLTILVKKFELMSANSN